MSVSSMTADKRRRKRRLQREATAAVAAVAGRPYRVAEQAAKRAFGTPAKQESAQRFARLQLQKWYDDSLRDTWRAIGVEMGRKLAREACRLLIEADHEPDFTDPKVLAPWQTLLDLAMVDHKLRHPRARGERLWAFCRGTGRGKASVKCRFCGRELIYDVKLGYDYTDEVAQHVVPCAVSSLATGGSVEPTHQPKSRHAP